VAGNLAPAADFGAFLDFNERADFHIVANLTSVKIGETEDADIPPQLHIRRNPLERVVGLTHEGRLNGRGRWSCCRSTQF
jgi:hypothetical protein